MPSVSTARLTPQQEYSVVLVPVTVLVEDVPKFTPEYLAKARDEMYREMFAEQRKNAGEAERLAIAGEIG